MSGIQYTKPTVADRGLTGTKDDGQRYTHPSFGVVHINSFSGGCPVFFGSDVKHQGGISISISRASLTRDLSNDWIFGEGNDLIEVQMSHLQFAELITMGIGRGDGFPCTIRRLVGEGVLPGCDMPSKVELFESEVDAKAEDAVRMLDEAIAMLESMSEGKTIKKSDLDAVRKKLASSRYTFEGGIKFAATQFKEQMQRGVADFRKNIEGYISHKLQVLGLAAAQGKTTELLPEKE